MMAFDWKLFLAKSNAVEFRVSRGQLIEVLQAIDEYENIIEQSRNALREISEKTKEQYIYVLAKTALELRK
jgi:hypothetical protein